MSVLFEHTGKVMEGISGTSAWCKNLNIRCVTRGTDPVLDRELAENLKLKQGLWRKDDKEIRTALDKLKKVKYINMPKTKRKRNYLREMTLNNTRLWFRYW